MNRIMNLRTQPVWREAKDYVFIALGMMMRHDDVRNWVDGVFIAE